MAGIVYFQSDRDELERGRQVHEEWKSKRPQEVPKSMRYVVGFSYGGEIPLDWDEFEKKFPLEERVKILSQAAPVGWSKEYNNWVQKTTKTPRFDGDGKYIFQGHPREIYQEEEEIKKKLKPASLRYSTRGARELYVSGAMDLGLNERVLVFYDDSFAAQIRLENYREGLAGPDAAPSADKVIGFRDGTEIRKNWSGWAPNLEEYTEREIRQRLGEDISSFELYSDDIAKVAKWELRAQPKKDLH